MSRMLSQFLKPHGSAFADALRILGEEHLAGERYKLARRNFSAALRVEPRNATVWLRYAQAWEDDPYGSDERAVRAYARAVKLDRGDAIAWAKLGRAAVRTNRTELAKKALARAITLAPANSAVLSLASESYRELGMVKKAWRMVCQARFLAPKDAAIRGLFERACYDRAAKKPREVSRATIPFLRVAGWRWDTPHAC